MIMPNLEKDGGGVKLGKNYRKCEIFPSWGGREER